MKVTATRLPEVLLLEPRVFGDERGFFLESYNRRAFNEAAGHDVEFVQDNHSRSARGVLRGLHYQLPPHAQGKLVRVTAGRVFDVAVDVRRSSPRFGQWVGVELSAENHRQLWIPPGFAHGFVVLTRFRRLSLQVDELLRATGGTHVDLERRDDRHRMARPRRDADVVRQGRRRSVTRCGRLLRVSRASEDMP